MIAYERTVYPKKYAHGFCFAVLCCGYTLTDFPISIRLTSLALWQSNDCPSASKATLMNMDKYFMWIHYERLHNHNKAKHNKTVCIFLGIYCECLLCIVRIYERCLCVCLFLYASLPGCLGVVSAPIETIPLRFSVKSQQVSWKKITCFPKLTCFFFFFKLMSMIWQEIFCCEYMLQQGLIKHVVLVHTSHDSNALTCL